MDSASSIISFVYSSLRLCVSVVNNPAEVQTREFRGGKDR